MVDTIFYDRTLRTLPMSNYWVRQTGFTMPVPYALGTFRIGYEAKQQNVGTLQVACSINGVYMPPNLILQDGEMYCPSCRLAPESTGDGFFKVDRDLTFKGGDLIEWFTIGALDGKSGWFKNAFVRTIEEELPELEPELPVPEFVACTAFGFIGDKFGSSVTILEDIGDWFEPIWVVGNEIRAFFYALGGPLGQAQELFYGLEDWCNELVAKMNEALNLDAIIVAITSTFAILSYTASDFVSWITDSLNETFHLTETWEWITNADDWLADKISDVVTFTADTIADMFEEILDKVFKE